MSAIGEATISSMKYRDIDFAAARLLILGDVMLDLFRYGSVSRISPEAPVPVLSIERDITMLGGAGNVLANARAIGCHANLIGLVGRDASGDTCAQLAEDLGADPALLVRSARRTSMKTRYISSSQQLLRCDEEDASPCDTDVEDEIIARFEAVVEQHNAVALSDYAKGLLSDRVLAHVIERCRQLSLPVIVDPKRTDFGAYAGASVIKPNRSELSAFARGPCRTAEQCEEAAASAIAQTGAALLVTLSDEGMVLYAKDAEPRRFQAASTEVFDVSGAGDTVLAIFTAAIASGLAMEEAAMLANVGAGIVVRKLGTASLTRDELVGALTDEREPGGDKVSRLSDAVETVSRWKAEGLRVGFTNGCFDIVHAGHIASLRQARARCDRLVVGLNSDASVTRLKGAGRPVQAESSRLAVMSAIDAVDLVVAFGEDTPHDLIAALRPTDLFKGADYREDEVVGADIVRAEGGKVHLLPLVPGVSTTDAVERIRRAEHIN